MHQPFEEYANSLGRTIQEEWAKIQGRYEDIPFSINFEETVHLIAKAIYQKNNKDFINLSNKISKLTNNGKVNKSLAEALSNWNLFIH